MKTFRYIGAIVLFCAAASVFAQSPVPEPDTFQSVKTGDPEIKAPVDQPNFVRNQVKILPTDIPEAVRKTLDTSPLYEGWQRGVIYKDKPGNTYTVEMHEGDRVRIFRFNKNGTALPDQKQ